ncbi:MAG: hypothetical protein V4503_09170 [Gemmatimonadota bacterium]
MRIQFLAPLLALAVSRQATAQSPDDRRALASWDSTLSSISDPSRLERLALPRFSTSVLSPVAEALRSARLTRLGKPRPLGRDYAAELGIVERDHSDWPWPAFASWRFEDAQLSGTGETDSKWTAAMRMHRRPAIRALLNAIAADSGFVPAHRELIRLAPYPLLWGTPEEELRMARAAGRSGQFDAEVVARRIQLELELGSVDSLPQLLAQVGDAAPSPARNARLRAEVEFATGQREDAVRDYHRGVAQILGPEDFDEFAADAEWIADSSEYRKLASLPVAEAAAFLETFWGRRDLEAARLPGERLEEHFRRYRIALHDYRDGTGSNFILGPQTDRWSAFVPDLPGFPQQQATAATDAPGLQAIPVLSDRMLTSISRPPAIRILDDRGIAFLRHGAPDKRLKYSTFQPGPGIPVLQYESWAYAATTQPLIIHFGQDNPANPGESIRTLPGGGDMLTACSLDAGYCMADQSAIRAERLSERGRRDGIAALTTDGNPLRYKKDLEVLAQTYGIPGGGVLAVVAIPADRLVPKGAVRDTLSEYTAHIRVIVGDPVTGRMEGSLDTVRTWRVSRKLGPGEWLSTWLEIPAPVGDWDVAIVASDTANLAGGGTRIPGVPVARFDGHTLRLGDPVLGRVSSGLDWRRRGASVPLNPTGAWRRDDVASLVYEVDGLMPGRSYDTRLEVWDARPGAKKAKAVITFHDVASATTQLMRRDLALREIGAGDFRLIIRIRDPQSGTEVSRARLLSVKR